MDSNSLTNARLRVERMAETCDWAELPEAMENLLWQVASVRPDFHQIPREIGAIHSLSENDEVQRATQVVGIAESLVRELLITRTPGTELPWQADPASELFSRARVVAQKLAEVSSAGEGVEELPIAVYPDHLHVGRHTKISFNRTLRVPEDGRDYPLPAGFGRLPLLRIEDYATKVPPQWMEEGGFFIPLYQAEALYLEFCGVNWRPSVAKISVGNVNVITGKTNDLTIKTHTQDYIVIPDQKYLDGINAGNGKVKQFVAMPLGEGYTIEAQITDEEKWGGFQLVIFEPQSGRFPDIDPASAIKAKKASNLRKGLAVYEKMLEGLAREERRIIELLKSHRWDLVITAGQSNLELAMVTEVFDRAAQAFDALGGKGSFKLFIEMSRREHAASDPGQGAAFMPSSKTRSSPDEMGIAAGGTIKQQILQDKYGYASWDAKRRRCISIRIINSQVFQNVTGQPLPPSPITKEMYHKLRIPWYSTYSEKTPTVGAAAMFRRLLTVGQIDRKRAAIPLAKISPSFDISPAQIVRIHTPTVQERFDELVISFKNSINAGRYHIAIREATHAIDLFDKHDLPFMARAFAHSKLGNYADAEADASRSLELDPTNIGALEIRAGALQSLGEAFLARKDAEIVLASRPESWFARLVRASASLNLCDYQQALTDADWLMCIEDADVRKRAICIRDTARNKLEGIQA